MGVNRDEASQIVRSRYGKPEDKKRKNELLRFISRLPKEGETVPTLLASALSTEALDLVEDEFEDSQKGGNVRFRHSFCAAGEEDLISKGRMSRIVEISPSGEAASIGSGSFVSIDTLATARHVVVDSFGQFLNVHVNDEPLEFVAASPKDDLALVRLKGQKCASPFRLASSMDYEIGRGLVLLAYPLAWDKELPSGNAVDPYTGQGYLSAMDGAFRGAGSYDGGFPNSSGGSVLFDSRTLAGTHLSSLWHEDDSAGSRFVDSAPVPQGYELDVNNLWGSAQNEQPPQPKPDSDLEGDLQGLRTGISELAIDKEYLQNQVPHKSSVGVFATATAIYELMKAAGLVKQGSLYSAIARPQTSTRKKRRVDDLQKS